MLYVFRLLPLCCSLILMLSTSLRAQEVIYIPEGKAPTIDGVLSPGEWDGSDTLSIDLLDGREVLVWYKRDSVALYCVFAGPLGSFGGPIPMFPEVSLDMDNSRSRQWDIDDWWFHISGNDCAARGNYEIYTDCEADPALWGGTPNFGPGLTPDTVEMYISFQKINLDLSITDTIGINFMVNNTSGNWRIWPDTADRAHPNTWAQAVFSQSSTAIAPEEGLEKLLLFPNPGQRVLGISYQGRSHLSGFTLYDVSLNPVFHHTLDQPNRQLRQAFDLGLPPAIYFVRFEFENGELWRKWLVH